MSSVVPVAVQCEMRPACVNGTATQCMAYNSSSGETISLTFAGGASGCAELHLAHVANGTSYSDDDARFFSRFLLTR
jgi:hypothetical protein